VLVETADFEGATAFYGDLLGFPVKEQWDDPDRRGTLFQCASTGVIEIIEAFGPPAERPRGVKVAVEVDDVDGLYDRIKQSDIDVVDPIGNRAWGDRSFEIRDPNDLPLVFFTATAS
jgi:catechol 2,3-dioxygenase-like lactoylglutathione lyase family enzyme